MPSRARRRAYGPSTVGTRRPVVLSLRPDQLRRYTRLVRLLIKLAREGGPENDDATPEEAEALVSELEAMGPTFVKLGQLLSTRADLLPDTYLAALSRLQDDCEPVPFDEIRQIVEEELGVRISTAFAAFDPDPIASASLGQVHRAQLRSGADVAVKVQRPNIRETIEADLKALIDMASLVDRRTEIGRRYGFEPMVEEFRLAMMDELDYRREATNLRVLAGNLSEFDRIVVPQPVPDYTRDRVLTMDYVDGRKLTAIGPLGRMELDGDVLGEQLFKAYVKQILVDGFFHADPHPGNVLLTRDQRLALIDLGMVARLSPELREHLVKLLLAVGEGRGEDAAEHVIAFSDRLDDFDKAAFTRRVARLVTRNAGVTIDELAAGRVVVEVSRASAECGLRPPPELSMLGKALLNLDEVVRVLAPDFDVNAALRGEAGNLVRHHLSDLMSPGTVLAAAIDAKEFAGKLPSRVNAVLDTLAEGEIRLNVKGIDEHEFMQGMQKLANRVTAGLIVAALIVGAAMLMRVDTKARLFGYPALAMVCFILAAASGFAIVGAALLGDRRR